jgi:hypothetical protein
MALKIQRRNFILGLGLASLMSHEKVNARVSGKCQIIYPI